MTKLSRSLRSLILFWLLAAHAMGAGELRVIVPTSSAGIYAVIRNPSNPAQAWDTNPGGWATYNRLDADQQISMSSAHAVGASDERQLANLPAGLDNTIAYEFDVYDSDDELIAPGVTALYPAVGATVPSNVTHSAGVALGTPGAEDGLPILDGNGLIDINLVRVANTPMTAPNGGFADKATLNNVPSAASNAAAVWDHGGATALNNSIGDLPTANENRDALMAAVLSGYTDAGTVGKALGDNLPVSGDPLPDLIGEGGGGATAEEIRDEIEREGGMLDGVQASIDNLPAPGTTQPRINRPPSIYLTASRRADGSIGCDEKVRLRPGTVDLNRTIGIDVSRLFGPHDQVLTVGTPIVSGGSITMTALGPRDEPPKQLAMVQPGGSATASERRTVDVPVTMESGDQAVIRVDVWVGGE